MKTDDAIPSESDRYSARDVIISATQLLALESDREDVEAPRCVSHDTARMMVQQMAVINLPVAYWT